MPKAVDKKTQLATTKGKSPVLSRRQQRNQKKYTVGSLKLLADRPELVDIHDVNAEYPVFM